MKKVEVNANSGQEQCCGGPGETFPGSLTKKKEVFSLYWCPFFFIILPTTAPHGNCISIRHKKYNMTQVTYLGLAAVHLAQICLFKGAWYRPEHPLLFQVFSWKWLITLQKRVRRTWSTDSSVWVWVRWMLRVLAARVRGRSRDWSKKLLEIVLMVAPRDKREARHCDVTLKSRQPFSCGVKKQSRALKLSRKDIVKSWRKDLDNCQTFSLKRDLTFDQSQSKKQIETQHVWHYKTFHRDGACLRDCLKSSKKLNLQNCPLAPAGLDPCEVTFKISPFLSRCPFKRRNGLNAVQAGFCLVAAPSRYRYTCKN